MVPLARFAYSFPVILLIVGLDGARDSLLVADGATHLKLGTMN